MKRFTPYTTNDRTMPYRSDSLNQAPLQVVCDALKRSEHAVEEALEHVIKTRETIGKLLDSGQLTKAQASSLQHRISRVLKELQELTF